MDRLSKKDWILLLLRQRPLDRIRLMKALFLIWHRSDRNLQDYFVFVPYMYGPCSFDLYHELERLEAGHMIAQAPHPVSQWAPYYLTSKGEGEVDVAANNVDEITLQIIRSIAKEVGDIGFHALLKRVYSEAPDFASKSVIPEGAN